MGKRNVVRMVEEILFWCWIRDNIKFKRFYFGFNYFVGFGMVLFKNGDGIGIVVVSVISVEVEDYFI